MTENRELANAVSFFTRETGIMDGLAVFCGQGERLESARDGNQIGEHTVFDLASVTKLFTGLCAMRLKEEGLLDFGRPVCAYDPRFQNLQNVTVGQLMAFSLTVQTPERLDACADRETALRCLFAAKAKPPAGPRVYSDIPAMILKYVIEAVSGSRLIDCVRTVILEKAGMRETWASVPDERRGDCLSYDLEHRIEKGKRILRKGLRPGVPHDPKAAVLQDDTDDLCGHAGLFSTGEDMIRFCRAVLAEKIVSGNSLREMSINRTGHLLPDGSYTQYLGYQCYLRHPCQYFSEIPAYMGGRAFGIGGFTGNHVSVDPESGVFVVFLGNRVRNRLTTLLPEEGKSLTDYGLAADGTGRFRWEDGTEVFSSVQYVHQKDAHFHRVVAKVLDLPLIPYDASFGKE